MKKPSFLNKFVLIAGLLLASLGFADECVDGTKWGDFTTTPATDSDGNGFYEIDSPEKLAWFACVTTRIAGDYLKKKIELTADIDLEGKLFIPISEHSNGGNKFAGTINGQNHTIRGLYIKGSEIIKPENGGAAGYAQNVGFVSVLGAGGIIENLVLKVSEIYASSSAGGSGSQGSSANPVSVGTLVGWMSGGTIKNCVVEGQITSSGSKNRVGGLAGNVWSATITDCVSNVSISASGSETHVGGVVGALRNGGEVNLSSCVFEGDTLISTGGKVGGIVGYYEKSNVKTQNALYYSGDYPGVGQGKSVETQKENNLNTENVICALNKGTWDDETKICSGATSDVWSEGQSAISMNGSDGYKITFDAKGGSFAAGAKKSKVVAKGATITADEISIPTHADSAFAGWAVTNSASSPSASLGVANAHTTIYAVWKPLFKITFNATPGVFPEENAATKVVRVSQGDSVSFEGFKVPTTYVDTEHGNTTYYFTGWALESKKFSEDHYISEDDTIHLASIKPNEDMTIYAVWIAAKTVTVTYKANEHGKTRVEFMRVEAGSSVAQPADPVAYEGYTFVSWCTETPCEHEFDFKTKISENLILYANWTSKRYAVTYEFVENANNEENPSSYTIDTTDIVLAKPTRDGYIFDGWFYNYSNNDGVEKFENQAKQITSGTTGAITLYAKWTPVVYIIEYLSGNTISATVRYVEKKHDVAITLSDSLDVFSHIGCVQGGWSKVDYGNEGYKVDYDFGATYSENAKLILFPYWTNCKEYGVIYVENGGLTNHGNPSSYRGPAALTLNNATWSQHDFAGWYKESNFKNKVEFIQDIDQDITLYAKWTRKIIYKPGAALSGTEAKDVTDNKQWNGTYTLRKSIDKYVRDNYILDGWSTSDGGEKEYELEQKISNDISLTLYPHWVKSRDSVQYGAVTVYTYAVSGRVEAVIDGSSMDEIDIPEGFGVDTVIYNRTFEAGKHSTIVLPFSISVDDVDGATFYELARVTKQDGKWKDVEVYAVESGTLTANTPYIVTTTGSTVTFKAPVSFVSTQTLDTARVNYEDGSRWEFMGTYQKIVFGDLPEIGRAYGFAAEEKDGAKIGNFVKAGPLAWMRPMRAYLVYEGNSGMTKSAVGSGFETELPDEINVVVQDEQGNVVERGVLNTRTGEIRMDSWYDLQGRKLNRKPETQGNYYHNGSRVIVK